MGRKPCTKCNGSGQYLNYGKCFRCGGTGFFASKPKGGPKYSEGDMIQHNQSGFIFVVTKVKTKAYMMNKYSKDGNTLIDTITHIGRHIDKYPDDSKHGYTKFN